VKSLAVATRRAGPNSLHGYAQRWFIRCAPANTVGRVAAVSNLLKLLIGVPGAIVAILRIVDAAAGTELIPSWDVAVLVFATLVITLAGMSFLYSAIWGSASEDRIGRRLSVGFSGLSGTILGTYAIVVALQVGEESDLHGFEYGLFGTAVVVCSWILWSEGRAAYRKHAKVKCSLCRERVHREAVRCKHCHGSLLPSKPAPVPVVAPEPRVLLHVALPMGVALRLERDPRTE
jgi:hypothetical protein